MRHRSRRRVALVLPAGVLAPGRRRCPVQADICAELIDFAPQRLDFRVVQQPSVDRLRVNGNADEPHLIDGAACLFHGEVDCLQRQQRNALQPFRVGFAVVVHPVVVGAAEGGGVLRVEVVEAHDPGAAVGAEQRGDVDSLDVHRLQHRGSVEAVAERLDLKRRLLLLALEGGVRLRELRPLVPDGEDLPLEHPRVYARDAAAAHHRHAQTERGVEEVLEQRRGFDDVNVAVENSESMFHARILPCRAGGRRSVNSRYDCGAPNARARPRQQPDSLRRRPSRPSSARNVRAGSRICTLLHRAPRAERLSPMRSMSP